MVSIIVPVYKSKDTLKRCVESLLAQTVEDTEMILVDDGSPDGSGELCDKLAEGDSRIRVIHKENGGVSSARNAGIEAAKGEYLLFADSDDYVEPDMVEKLLSSIGDDDIAICGFHHHYQGRDIVRIPEVPGQSGEENFLALYGEGFLNMPWNKLYKRVLFDGIFFEEGHKIDDEYFTYQGVMNAAKVVCDPRVVYNYRQRASSVMQSPAARAQIAVDRIDFMAKRREKVLERFPELRREFDISFVDALSYLADYPDNTEESIRLLKYYARRYFLQRGNTFPPRYLLKAVFLMYVTSTEKLLKRPQAKKPSPEDYYA